MGPWGSRGTSGPDRNVRWSALYFALGRAQVWCSALLTCGKGSIWTCKVSADAGLWARRTLWFWYLWDG